MAGEIGASSIAAVANMFPGGMLASMGAAAATEVVKPASLAATSSTSGTDFSKNINFGSGSASSAAPQSDVTKWVMIGGALIALALIARMFKR